MKKNAMNEMYDRNLAELAQSVLEQLGVAGGLDGGILTDVLVTAIPMSAIFPMEEDDYDDDEWEDEDDWNDDYEEDCPDYEPISEDNDSCLYRCPDCGVCMRQYFEEVCK